MALDIRNGDFLTVAGVDYPIRSVAYWGGYPTAGSFVHLATVEAATKRSPAIASGKVGTPVIQESYLKTTPLDPVDPELRQRLALDTPHEVLQTFVPDGAGYFQLILEELKR